MPTYEYECLKCGHEFEVFQKISDAPRSRCSLCKGKVRRKVGAGAGLLFKGSGFYTTDYRSDSYKSAASAEKTGSSSVTTASKEAKGKSDSTAKK